MGKFSKEPEGQLCHMEDFAYMKQAAKEVVELGKIMTFEGHIQLL